MYRLGKYLSSLTKPELETLKEQLNLTEDEEKIFYGLARGKSVVSLSEENMVSMGTIKNRSKDIKVKIERVSLKGVV